MMIFNTPIRRLVPAAALLALSPALFADDSIVTFTNGTGMDLTLTMDAKAEAGLEVHTNFDGEPWTFTGGSQVNDERVLRPGASVLFTLASEGRTEGAMDFEVKAPANSRIFGFGSSFTLTFTAEYKNRQQVATLATDLNDQSLLRGGTYTYFRAEDDGARGLRIHQVEVVERPEAERSSPNLLDEMGLLFPSPQAAQAALPPAPPSPVAFGDWDLVVDETAAMAAAAAAAAAASGQPAGYDEYDLIKPIEF